MRSNGSTFRSVFGGSGPAIVTWLGTFAPIGDLTPGYFLTAVCLFSLWALITTHVTSADKTFTSDPTKV